MNDTPGRPLGRSGPLVAPAPRARSLLTLIGLVAAVVASFIYLDLGWSQLFTAESARLMAKFAREFFPPDVSAAFLHKTTHAALQTLAVSAVATLLATLAGAALALPAAGRLGTVSRPVSRMLLNVLRSVPELVWAALMVLAAGLGPFAGTLALALHTTGVLGRLFAEALENASPHPETALRDAGAAPVPAFAYGTLPLVLPQWLAYALYRWEMNIRMAAVLGFVGAGGLGQMLHFHLSLFHQAQAATVLCAMFILVFVVDVLSARLRRDLAPAYA